MALGVFDKNVFDPAVFLCDSDSAAASGVGRKRSYRAVAEQIAVEREARRLKYMAGREQLHTTLKEAVDLRPHRHDYSKIEESDLKTEYATSLRLSIAAARHNAISAINYAHRTEEMRAGVSKKRAAISAKRSAVIHADDEALVIVIACQ